MSDTDPIAPGSPLDRALKGGADVPAMSDDFADRVVARAVNRPAALPETRGHQAAPRRWRSVKRLGLGLAVTGAVASAAAASGLLGELPSPRQVWEAITGEAEPAPTPTATVTSSAASEVEPLETGDNATQIEGAIDTPEELEEVLERFDERRSDRKATRRENVDRRIDAAIERRRAQGLPAPTPEQEARMRERIEQFRDRRDAATEARIEQRREQLRDRVEAGEELTREDLRGPDAAEQPATGRQRPLRELRNLSPAERRQRIRELRQRRLQQNQVSSEAAEEPTVEPEQPAETSAPDEPQK